MGKVALAHGMGSFLTLGKEKSTVLQGLTDLALDEGILAFAQAKLAGEKPLPSLTRVNDKALGTC